MKRTAFYLLVLISLAACATPPPRPAELARGDLRYLEQYMDWFFAKEMSKSDVPAVSVALVSDEKVLWKKAYGYADAERAVPATTRTVFQVGSISKVLTAAAVTQQVERGRLDLDAPIQEYLPEFSIKSRWRDAPPITLRQLLSHHAGLPTYYLKGFFSQQPLAELVEALRDEQLAYPPGRIFNYSNLGPDIAGAALERISGLDFAAYMQGALLEPLGMQESSFPFRDRARPVSARGYVKRSPIDAIPIRDAPAGGLFSNAEDMARFMRMILNGGEIDGRRVLSREAVAAMMAPQFADTPYDFGQHFGLGWMLSGIPVHNAGLVAWHNGGTKGFLSQMVLLPEKKLGVIVLANADTAGPMTYKAAEEVLRLALETRYDIKQPPPTPRAPEVTLAPAQLDHLSGDYSLMGALAHIERSGNRLRLRVFDKTLELVPVGDKKFRAAYRILGLFAVPIPFPPIEFTEIEGRVIMLWRDRGIAITAEKVPPYSIPAAWHARVGDYHLTNPDEEYLVDLKQARMSIENGRILMNIRIAGLEDREAKVVVMPLDDDTAYTFGIGRNVGGVTTAERHNGRERMRYLGYYFERDTEVAGLHRP